MDPRVMNKCPTFSSRDTEWNEWSFIFESVAAIANLEPAMAGLAEKPLLVNTVREKKALTLVRSAEKHHGLASWKRIETEYQPDAAGRHTAMLMGIMQPGWDSRGAANTFLDQLTEWERRIQEYQGESLETFSDGVGIAILASHAPECSKSSKWQLSCSAPEHVRVSSVWPNLRQAWSRSGVGTQRCERDADGCCCSRQRQGKGMLRVPRNATRHGLKIVPESSQKQEDKVNSVCHELQTNPQLRNEHAMKSHTLAVSTAACVEAQG